MTDKTKKAPPQDLTGIIEYAKKMQDSGQAPEAPKGSVMEEIPIEKIDNFESLDEYAVANPAPDLLSEPAFDPSSDSDTSNTESAPPVEPAISGEGFETTSGTESAPFNLEGFDSEPQPIHDSTATGGGGSGGGGGSESAIDPLSQQDFATSEFPTSDSSADSNMGDFGQINSDTSDTNPNPDFSTEGSSGSTSDSNDFLISEGSESTDTSQSGDFGSEAGSDLNAPNFGAEISLSSHPVLPKSSHEKPGHGASASGHGASTTDFVEAPPKPPKLQKPDPTEKLTFKKDLVSQPSNAMENIKKYSEQPPTTKSAVAASFPFSILIRGELRPEEKEKLLSLIENHQMGFRAIDLEPQLASGRILIPRISEYAGVLIIQALRGTRAEMKLGPSDSIFSTADTHDTAEEIESLSIDESSTSHSSELTHPAEAIPVTSLDRLPGAPKLTLIDTVTANAALKSTVVEAEHSSAFQEIVEALQKELKYKAYRKGATAVLNFKIQVNYLSSPTQYRIMAFGSAVKPAAPSTIETVQINRSDGMGNVHPIGPSKPKREPKGEPQL